VTESITGLNIPSLQLIVSMGCDLTKIDHTLDTPVKEISPYLVLAPGSAEEVESHRVTNPFSKTNGHCVAVRVTAENAADGWKPTVGTIREIDFQSMPGVWGYFSVRSVMATPLAALIASLIASLIAAPSASLISSQCRLSVNFFFSWRPPNALARRILRRACMCSPRRHPLPTGASTGCGSACLR
jgi:biotin carboxylase